MDSAEDLWGAGDDIDITEIEGILDQSEHNNTTRAKEDSTFQTPESYDSSNVSSRLRVDDQYSGFDGNVGQTWIYPNNLPCRSYQLSIAQAALYRNTLVVLPTGLGKTFIAAVVMYNIYRWYPKGKVLFMAPTRPLVAQQIGACQNVMSFPSSDTVDITGKVRREKRMEYWRTKRVFFATPQVVLADMITQSDQLSGETFPFKDIKLVVVDEAHRAKGRYAYTEVMQLLFRKNRYFRVLALSATPGRTVDDVAEIVRNLFISHLEVRWDNSIDVCSYVHKRSIKTVVVPLGDNIKAIRDELVKIIDPFLRQLIDASVLSGSHQHVTRNFLLFEHRRFQERSLHERHPDHSAVNQNFSICISLFHSLELLERHGLRVFINSFDQDDEGREKFVLGIKPLKELINRVRDELGPNPFDISTHNMTNGCLPEIPANLDFGHPKFQRARECLLEHFENNSESRSIVFCEYRESVMLIYRLLLQHMPMLRPRCFVGQGGTSGPLRALSQKQQIQIMQDFRSGKSNILIATSIGEEGIDVGEVDLIVCFDISTSNPTRFIQRIGRTGRQRKGSVVILVTEGKEQQTLKEVLANKDQVNKKILNSSIIKGAYYQQCPRLVPNEYSPKCVQTFIEPSEPKDKGEKILKKAKATKISKNTKSKASEATTSVKNTQDLRKFLKGPIDNADDEDFEIFEKPSKAKEIDTQARKESCAERVKNLFKGLNMNPLTYSNTQLLETQNHTTTTETATTSTNHAPRLSVQQIKKINRLLKSTNDIVPKQQRQCSLLDMLKTKKVSHEGKLYVIKQYYGQVRELFEKMHVLQALDIDDDMSIEEKDVRETCEEILKLFENRETLERFLEDAEYEVKFQNQNQKRCTSSDDDNDNDEFDMSDRSFNSAMDKIFDGLDVQGNNCDNFDFRQEELKKTNAYKEFMRTKDAKQEESKNVPYSMVFDKGTFSESSTQADELNIMNSEYCSQWIEKDFDGSLVQNSSKALTSHHQSPSINASLNDSPLSIKPIGNKNHQHQSPMPSSQNKDTSNKSTSLSGPLARAFERQKVTMKARKTLDTNFHEKISNNVESLTTIEIDSDDEEMFSSVCSNYEIPKSSINEVPKRIEMSFMLRQQSTPIPSKSKINNIEEPSPIKANDLDINMDDFAEPFPEELDFLTQKPDMLSGSSLKENNQPIVYQTTKQNNYIPKINKINDNTPPSKLKSSRNFVIASSLIDSPKTPTPTPTSTNTSDLFQLLEVKPTNSVMTPKFTSNVCKRSADITSPTAQTTLLDSPKTRPNTSLSVKAYETSPSIFCTYMEGLQRFQSKKKSSSTTLKTTQENDESPIIASKQHKIQNLKRKVIESDSESEIKAIRNSDSDFETINATQQPKKRCLSQQREKRLRRARLCEFFEQEAGKSNGAGHTTDEGEDDDENTLANFVCDTVIVNDDSKSGDDCDDDRPTATQMQAVYLQSVKSPYQRRGGFKIPERRELPIREDIYSQEIPIEQSQYDDDSFVVHNDVEATIQQTLCPLERAEKILKERKRRAKRQRFAEVGTINHVKKRVRKCYQLQNDSDTSDGVS